MAGKRIKVLVVDDSMVFREIMARALSSDPGLLVVTAGDPFEARDRIEENAPDVLVCDVEMPRMNGIEFLRRLLPQYPVPAVIVSSAQAGVFDAMHAGAVDFLAKPGWNTVSQVEPFLMELIAKVKTAAATRVVLPGAAKEMEPVPSAMKPAGYEPGTLIAIGASTGGTEGLARIMQELPPGMPPIAIVQHIPPLFSELFAERLDRISALRVKEAADGDKLLPGVVLLAPGDRHMRVKRLPGGGFGVELHDGERVNGHKPSVDLLFESVAREAGSHAVGVILTGMGYDGAKGLMAMRRKGARTVGQDEASSVVYGMPKAAYEIGAVEKQIPLERMARHLVQLLNGR
ncbi:protein-glutamate methylesterase/protein-glutamine glutaminase [Gorillibacterium sp. sgz5001074]|uniref:protein-glutamate methylesterase/protein-glutamine glutaminase n=1 Tax=Gorillibacterium sp. sgz5001074 TaxID=3446695 RepID=UPI003F6724FD